MDTFQKVIRGLRKRENEIQEEVRIVADMLPTIESNLERLPNLFVTQLGKDLSEAIIRVSKFADYMVHTSIWADDQFAGALKDAFGNSYTSQLKEEMDIDDAQAQAIANWERKRMESVLSIAGHGERQVEWNRFVLLTQATAIYSYCGVFVEEILRKLLSSSERKLILLEGLEVKPVTSDMHAAIKNHLRGDTYNRIQELIRCFGMTDIISSHMTTKGIKYLQEEFLALKRGRDQGSHVRPELSVEDFMTGKVRRKIKEFIDDMDRGDRRRKALSPSYVKEIVEEVEKESGKLPPSQKIYLEQHLESGEDDSISKAIFEHIRAQAGINIILSWLPISGTVFPAIFERCFEIVLDVLEMVGI